MERGFINRPEPEDEFAMEYYNRIISFVSNEIVRDPEALQEITHLQSYARLMQQLLIRSIPPSHQDEISFAVNRTIESISLPGIPVKLPPPGKFVTVGEHMTVTSETAAECWPGKSAKSIVLDDLTEIRPKTPIGRIDLVRNLPRLDTSGSVIAFTRSLMTSTVQSLRELAQACQNREEQLVPLQAMAGMSHLARMGKRFGFTVFEIEDKVDQEWATRVSRSVSEKVAGNNHAWQKLAAYYKPAEIAYISKDRLVELYGPEGPQNIVRRMAR